MLRVPARVAGSDLKGNKNYGSSVPGCLEVSGIHSKSCVKARCASAGSSLAFPSVLGVRDRTETDLKGVLSGAGVALCAATVSASSAGETASERHVSELPSIAGDDGIMNMHEDSHSRHRRFSACVSGDRGCFVCTLGGGSCM